MRGLAIDGRGSVLVAGSDRGAWRIPLDGSPPAVIEGLPKVFPCVSPDGRLAAAAYVEMVVVDLETGERREFDPPGEGGLYNRYRFDAAGRLLVARGDVLSRWDPATGATEVIADEPIRWFRPLADGRHLLVYGDTVGKAVLDIEDGSRLAFWPPGPIDPEDFDPTLSTMIASDHRDNTIRVGPRSGGEPHLLVGHEDLVHYARLSPDGRWIASVGTDRTIRLWPMPDISRPPLHTLPHDELMATLRAMTNLRAVPDEESYTGYRLEPDFSAYRGWAEVPTW
jgi:WD40 repeat protein